MVRIRVIHASKLLVIAAAILLAAALAALAIRSAGARAVLSQGEEAVLAAFSFFEPPPMRFELPGSGERPALVEAPARTAPAAGLRILIYHTHTHEAYAQVEDTPYVETEAWRTEDAAHSVVRVGDALAQLLEARGCAVTHDVTDHEYPRLSTAYARSLETLLSYAGEPFDLCIDLHRDAWDSSQAECALVGGQRAAQLMLLVGDGGDYDVRPDYEANLAFAARLTDRLNALSPGLCRPVLVKHGRYNQHVRTPSALIEVGHNLNTLAEALCAMPVLAEALCDVLGARRDPPPETAPPALF